MVSEVPEKGTPQKRCARGNTHVVEIFFDATDVRVRGAQRGTKRGLRHLVGLRGADLRLSDDAGPHAREAGLLARVKPVGHQHVWSVNSRRRGHGEFKGCVARERRRKAAAREH